MKKGEHSFGNTQELLTPKNMKTYFDMETKLIELDTDDGIKKISRCVIKKQPLVNETLSFTN